MNRVSSCVREKLKERRLQPGAATHLLQVLGKHDACIPDSAAQMLAVWVLGQSPLMSARRDPAVRAPLPR